MDKKEYQQRWRDRTDRVKVEVYLAPEIVEQLAKLVERGGYRGRGEALTHLIKQTMPGTTKPIKSDK